MFNQSEKREAAAQLAEQVDKKLFGIRGWLILPAIGLVLSLILSPAGAIAHVVALGERHAAYSGLFLLVNTWLYVWLWILAVRFFKKDRAAPETFVRFMVARIMASVILFILGVAVVGRWGDARYFPLIAVGLLKANPFIAQALAASIWIPYFKMSKRVKATFAPSANTPAWMTARFNWGDQV